MSKFFKGARVAWQYTHSLNSKSRAVRFKHGTFVRDHKEGDVLTGLCYVRFDGNKTDSRVALSQLKWLEQE